MSDWNEEDAFDAAAVPLSQRAMAARGAPYLEGLNPAQREAVEALDGPVLMLAGAGTGKTKALTTRIAHLLATGRARPNEILSVTFTNKAAREMKNRVGGLMGEAVEGMPWLGTFHSICVKLLRRHAELVGLKSNFTILDTDDQIRLIKQLIVASGMDDKRWPARALSNIIDGWKNRAITPEKVPVAEGSAFDGRGPALYAQYQTRLLELNAVDFGDLLLHVVGIFQKHGDVLAQYQRYFRFILVDEYQDTNVAQYMWLRLLAQSHQNICCVGDDDQSIYGWRGAEVGNILRFEKDFPGAKVVRLEQNYRSTVHILAAASGVIEANQGRLGKTLWTDRNEGEKVRLIGHWDGEEEARWIGDEIEAAQGGTRGMQPFSLDDMAILVRASHQMRAFEDRFLTIGLPYRVIGGPRFYERMEIRDAMAYFRLAVSPSDDLAFERIVNTPKRGLGDKAQQKIQMAARSNNTSLVEGARILVATKGLGGKGGAELAKLVEGLDRWTRIVRDDASSHVETAQMILEESGYIEMWQNDKTPEAPGRLENLKELVKALEEFENLQGFLEHVSLIMDNETESDGAKVSIMTLHAAKGLEFPVLFLPGWEDGLFPSQRSMDESGLKGVEEERRLAYVGITRAEQLCTISFAANRRVFGQWQSALPSRFIDELPEEHVEVLTPPGLYGGGFGAAAPSSGLEAAAAEANVYNSPGWRRLQSRASQRPVSQPKEQRNMVIDLDAASSFSSGDRVFHQKFGYGLVTGMEGDKLSIAFDKAGEKNVLARFIVTADAADDVPF
ncbi:MAG: UvrD-helicase domain-containing protein [Pseudomonadota bacterium]